MFKNNLNKNTVKSKIKLYLKVVYTIFINVEIYSVNLKIRTGQFEIRDAQSIAKVKVKVV